MKLKPGLGAFYAFWPGNGFGLFNSSQGLHVAHTLEKSTCTVVI